MMATAGTKSASKQNIMSFKEFERILQRGKEVGGQVFFYGSEAYLLDRAVRLFVETHLDESSREYGRVILDGENSTWADIENALKTMPMFTTRKVIILSHPGHLSGPARSALTEYFSQPCLNTWLGLVEPQVDWRKKPFKEWSEMMVRVQCEPLTDEELSQWISDTVEAEGFRIAPESIRVLEAVSDGDMQIIIGILEKAFLLTEPGDAVTQEILQTATGDSCRYTWDSLLSAMASRDFSALWSVVDYLQKQVPSPTFFTQILSRSFQGALLAQQFQGEIPFDINVYKSIGYFGKSRTLIQNMARGYSREEIEEALRSIRQADRELKTSSKSSGPLIQALLAKIILSEKIRNRKAIRE
jgi:DNA polymerase-3 subunit delta